MEMQYSWRERPTWKQSSPLFYSLLLHCIYIPGSLTWMDQAERFLQVAFLTLLFLLSFTFLTRGHQVEPDKWEFGNILQPRPLRVECKMISNSMCADGPPSPVLNGSCAMVPLGKSGLQSDRVDRGWESIFVPAFPWELRKGISQFDS